MKPDDKEVELQKKFLATFGFLEPSVFHKVWDLLCELPPEGKANTIDCFYKFFINSKSMYACCYDYTPIEEIFDLIDGFGFTVEQTIEEDSRKYVITRAE